MTVPAGESIVKVASNCVTWPRAKPKRPAPKPVCGPIVNVPSSVKVPGYGPRPIQYQWKAIVELPLGSQVAARSKSCPAA